MNTTTKTTPLAEWLRAAAPEQRARLADLAGTSVNYLYQLAGCSRKEPKARLALAIESATIKLYQESNGFLPVITARTMAAMCCIKEAGAAGLQE